MAVKCAAPIRSRLAKLVSVAISSSPLSNTSAQVLSPFSWSIAALMDSSSQPARERRARAAAARHAGVQPLDKGFEILQTLNAVRMDDEEIAISIQRVVHGKRSNFESDRFLQAGRPRKRTD